MNPWFGLVAGLALAACGHSAEPTFYALSPIAGRSVPSKELRVKLLRVGLPQYLDREAIVLRIREHRLEIAAGEHWSEPLVSMLTRVLAENLAARLPNAHVFAEGASFGVASNTLVNVQVEKFELTEDSATLQAQVIVCNEACAAAVFERIHLSSKIDAYSTAAMVAAEERLLGNLADNIARMLTR